MRMAVVGEGYKVHLLPFGEVVPLEVVTLDDQPVAEPREEVVRRLLEAAVAAQARP